MNTVKGRPNFTSLNKEKNHNNNMENDRKRDNSETIWASFLVNIYCTMCNLIVLCTTLLLHYFCDLLKERDSSVKTVVVDYAGR